MSGNAAQSRQQINATAETTRNEIIFHWGEKQVYIYKRMILKWIEIDGDGLKWIEIV